MPITSNRKNHSAVIQSTANITLTVAGNNSVSNLCVNSTSDEIITGCTIRQVYYGGNAGYWEIKRGANTVAVLGGTGHADYSDYGISLNTDPTATLVANFTGTGPAYIIIEVSKQGAFTSQYG